MLAKDIKRGMIVNYNGGPCMIETISVQSPSARGAATYYKYRARNLVSRQKVDITLRGGDSLDEADFQRRSIRYLTPTATYLLHGQRELRVHRSPGRRRGRCRT